MLGLKLRAEFRRKLLSGTGKSHLMAVPRANHLSGGP